MIEVLFREDNRVEKFDVESFDKAVRAGTISSHDQMRWAVITGPVFVRCGEVDYSSNSSSRISRLSTQLQSSSVTLPHSLDYRLTLLRIFYLSTTCFRQLISSRGARC